MENNKTFEEEIDLVWLVGMRFIAFIAAVVTASMVAGYTFFRIEPTYSSTSTMLVLTKETTLTSLTDLQIGSTLTKDYSVLITSRPVLESVIENLGLKMGHKALKGRISVDNPEDTRLLFITVTMNDAKQAKAVVDELSIVASEFIGDKMEVTPPKIIEQGEIGSKNGPSITKNAMVGFLAGAFLVCVIIVVLELLNDTIKKKNKSILFFITLYISSTPKSIKYLIISLTFFLEKFKFLSKLLS